jgi:hypothetical protein
MAGKVIRTEHSGAKHGSGAYWGSKSDAKVESNRARRREDRNIVIDVWAAGPDSWDSKREEVEAFVLSRPREVWCVACAAPSDVERVDSTGVIALCYMHALLQCDDCGRYVGHDLTVEH